MLVHTEKPLTAIDADIIRNRLRIAKQHDHATLPGGPYLACEYETVVYALNLTDAKIMTRLERCPCKGPLARRVYLGLKKATPRQERES